jgi:hypothetical protein
MIVFDNTLFAKNATQILLGSFSYASDFLTGVPGGGGAIPAGELADGATVTVGGAGQVNAGLSEVDHPGILVLQGAGAGDDASILLPSASGALSAQGQKVSAVVRITAAAGPNCTVGLAIGQIVLPTQPGTRAQIVYDQVQGYWVCEVEGAGPALQTVLGAPAVIGDWYRLGIEVGATSTSFFIDGSLVASIPLVAQSSVVACGGVSSGDAYQLDVDLLMAGLGNLNR